jgi:hypothetical protein
MSYEDAPIYVSRTHLPVERGVTVPLKRDIPVAAHLPHRVYTGPAEAPPAAPAKLSLYGHTLNKIAGEYDDKFRDFNIDDINSVERFVTETEKISRRLDRITDKKHHISPITDADRAIIQRIRTRGRKIENQLIAKYPDRFFRKGRNILMRSRVDG